MVIPRNRNFAKLQTRRIPRRISLSTLVNKILFLSKGVSLSIPNIGSPSVVD
jgi:hypothetical protein